MAIHFSNQNISFNLNNKTQIKNWINLVVKNHNKKLGVISYLFCDDDYIYDVNLKYLNHDTYTDIITFDYVEGDTISGDIVISVERVRENAKKFNVPVGQELHRVIIHGVLHLLGFKDKTEREAATMRKKEEECLALFDSCIDTAVSRGTKNV